jgi:hypothetical protein
MSDPRIYHRVGPNAPEGRQIYDDIRRRDLGLSSSFNSQLSTVNSTLTGEITTLEGQVNALAVTPVSIGTSTETSPITIISTGIGVSFSALSVVPVAAKPFFIMPQGYLQSFSALLTQEIRWYETTSGSPVLLEVIVPSSLGTLNTPLFYQTIVPNTATTTRTFELYVERMSSGGSPTATWTGTSKAFQWTVA